MLRIKDDVRTLRCWTGLSNLVCLCLLTSYFLSTEESRQSRHLYRYASSLSHYAVRELSICVTNCMFSDRATFSIFKFTLQIF